MSPKMLFSGYMDYALVLFGITMLLVHALLILRAKRAVVKNISAWQKRLGNMLFLFPMGGILGTVSGLMTTMNYIAVNGTSDMEAVMGLYATALSTTVWGILFAILGWFANTLLEVRIGKDE